MQGIAALLLACLTCFAARATAAQDDLGRLVEKLDLKDAPRTEWPLLVGRKLAKKPNLLTPAARKTLGYVLAKEADVVAALERLKDTPAQAQDEALWFYLEVLKGPERQLADFAACAVEGVAGRMDAAARQELVDAAFGFLASEERDTRAAGTAVLARVGAASEGKALESHVRALLAKARDEKERPEVRLGAGSAAGGQVVRVGAELRERIVEATLQLTGIETIQFRYSVSVLLADLARRLEAAPREGLLGSLLQRFLDKRRTAFARGFFAYDMAVVLAQVDVGDELVEKVMTPVVAHANDPDVDPYHVYDGWTNCGQKFKGRLAQDAARAALTAMKGAQPTAVNIAAAALIRLAPQLDRPLVDTAVLAVEAASSQQPPDFLKKTLARLSEALEQRKTALAK